MSIIENAIAWALQVAEDAAHGYDQTERWGPNYDCSSFVIRAFKEAGLPLTATFTGNMRYDFLKNGFVDASEVGTLELNMGAGLKRGDVLLHERNHTALYLGNGQIVQASINELGTVTGGRTGDQTGREIGVRNYYNYPWDCVLRYVEDSLLEMPVMKPEREKSSVMLQTVQRGDVSGAVLSMQTLLIHKWAISCGPDGADGEFGENTEKALRSFQRVKNIEDDGVCGPVTWAEIIGG